MAATYILGFLSLLLVFGGVAEGRAGPVQNGEIPHLQYGVPHPQENNGINPSPCDCPKENQNQNVANFMPSRGLPVRDLKQLDLEYGVPAPSESSKVPDYSGNMIGYEEKAAAIPKVPMAVLKDDSNIIKQVIFIEPPEYVYKHDIQVAPTEAPKRPRTVIYVFPPMVKHIYNVTHKKVENPKEGKEGPQIYYLKSKHFLGNENENEKQAESDKEEEEEKVKVEDNKGGYSFAEEVAETTVNPEPVKFLSSKPKEIIVNAEESRPKVVFKEPVVYFLKPDKRAVPPIRESESRLSPAPSSASFVRVKVRRKEEQEPTAAPLYRKITYLSKSHYDELKESGQLQPNYVQYSTGYVTPPEEERGREEKALNVAFTPPPPPLGDFGNIQRIGEAEMKQPEPSKINVNVGSFRMNPPSVRISYEDADSGESSLPAKQVQRFQWNLDLSEGSKRGEIPIFSPKNYDSSIQPETDAEVMQRAASSFTHFPEESYGEKQTSRPQGFSDSEPAGSETNSKLSEERGGFDFIPALFKNYWYQSP